jgi:hypothetical protein
VAYFKIISHYYSEEITHPASPSQGTSLFRSGLIYKMISHVKFKELGLKQSRDISNNAFFK